MHVSEVTSVLSDSLQPMCSTHIKLWSRGRGRRVNALGSVTSVAQSCPTLCDPMDCSMPGLPVPHDLLKLAQVHVHCIGDAIQPSHPLMPSSPASIFPSIKDFFNESSGPIRWPKYWSFSFSISPSSDYSGSISIKIDWFDLLAIQGTFRSPLLSSTTVRRHQFFGICLLYGPAITTVCDH